MHTPPANAAEVRAVLELFPKCTACGAPLDSTDAVPDGNHAFRMRHRGPCPACTPEQNAVPNHQPRRMA